MRYRLAVALAIGLVVAGFRPAQITNLRFQVTTNLPAASGRLLVVIARRSRPEPRELIGEAGSDAPVMLGRDVKSFGPGAMAIVDKTAATFQTMGLALDALPAGDYAIQAVLRTNNELNSPNAPGDEYSNTESVHLDPHQGGTVNLRLTNTVPAEQHPPEDEYVKYVKIQSNLLTRFHGRPIFLRAGVILPKDYDGQRKFPLRVHIGGYGTRYTAVQRLMSRNSDFRRMWLADDTPRFIFLQLDGDGPFGDPYQVNSDNNGPYGDAVTQELIPYVEKTFGAIGRPYARVLDGESTGGWVSLALKVFYPDFFDAVWSSCPDGLDFRGFQIINIYEDKNAYKDDLGHDRPSKRALNGNIEFTIRHECQMENVMGAGDSWTMSGQQWGAWNATYGPRGHDGKPVPLWDPKTGVIDKSVVDHWKKYDLRLLLQENWRTLGPKLRGKIHISVGEADSYYLEKGVHLLDGFLKNADPPAEARITYGPGQGHCWISLSEQQLMREMFATVRQSAGLVPVEPGGLLGWTYQPSGVNVRLRGVSAVDSKTVWASGNNGTFLRTIDGIDWESGIVPGAADLDFRDVQGVSASTAYLLSAGSGSKSRIYKTTDAGKSWTLQFLNQEPEAFFDGFAFWDAIHGIAFGDPVNGRFSIIRTNNGGTTWSPIPSVNLPIAISGEAAFAASGSSIAVTGHNDVWFATGGAAARVFHSRDQGLTWSVANTPIVSGVPSAGIFSIFFVDQKHGFVVGGDYQKENESSANFAWTKDGGRTWVLGPNLPGYRSTVAALSTTSLIAAGPSGVDHLLPGADSWVNETSASFDAMSFLPHLNVGFAVGLDGRIAQRKPMRL